jgi:NADH dehydrogenase
VALIRRLAKACAAAGVAHVLHVSALGVGPGAPSLYLRSKAQGEEVLRASALRTTVLRPSVIFGQGDRFLNLFAALQAFVPVLALSGGSSRFQPVWVEDVAEALVRCMERPTGADAVIECTGPRVYTLRELVGIAGRYSGRERPVIELPPALGRLQALAMEMAPGTPLMSRDNLLSMQVPSIASGRLHGLDALGITPSSLEAVAPVYLSAHQGAARFSRWRALRSRG